MKRYSDNLVRCMCTCYNWTIDVSSATFSFICILSSETLQGPGTWIWEGGIVVQPAGPFTVCTHSHKERWSDIHLCSRDSLWQRNAVTEPSVCCCNAGLGHESKTLRKVQMIIFRVCDMQSNIKRNKKKVTTERSRTKIPSVTACDTLNHTRPRRYIPLARPLNWQLHCT